MKQEFMISILSSTVIAGVISTITAILISNKNQKYNIKGEKGMEVKGKIKSFKLNEKTLTIKFSDLIKANSEEKIVFLDSTPVELNKWKDKEFNFSNFNESLIYQFFKDQQELIFKFEEKEDENKANIRDISNLEIIDE